MGKLVSCGSTPLAGIRVIEFCNVAAGPFCAMLLADMGADVIKVEPVTGDTLRQWPPLNRGFSENFAALNRNKRSIALELKNPVDKALAVRLIKTADVVIENNRAGAMSRLGLGYDAFSDCCPKLIYCSLTAFGQEGPRAYQGGFDLTVQALSGIMSVTGDAGGDPVKCGVPISDFSTGLYGAFSIAALLARVKSGGRGGYIDVSMLGSSLAIAALQTSEYFGSGRDPIRLGAAHPRNAPYQAFRASDGDFVLAAGNDKLWRVVCTVTGRLDLVEQPCFRTTADRANNQKDLAAIMNSMFADQTVDVVLAKLEKAGVPCSRINQFSEALNDPQVKHMGWIQEIDLPTGRRTRTFASPVRIDGGSAAIDHGPPALDADREAVLHELLSLEAAAQGIAVSEA
jgi:crotonobetainyl-CoA:carnitine CoA-transferase CaiB-like acyl-CoA transferase